MKCKSEFVSGEAPHFHRPVFCEMPKGHKGWHEYGLTMWEGEKPKEPVQRARR